jgi:hypothetical protein
MGRQPAKSAMVRMGIDVGKSAFHVVGARFWRQSRVQKPVHLAGLIEFRAWRRASASTK